MESTLNQLSPILRRALIGAIAVLLGAGVVSAAVTAGSEDTDGDDGLATSSTTTTEVTETSVAVETTTTTAVTATTTAGGAGVGTGAGTSGLGVTGSGEMASGPPEVAETGGEAGLAAVGALLVAVATGLRRLARRARS